MLTWSAIRELVDTRVRAAVSRIWTISTYKRVQASGTGDQVYAGDEQNTYSAQRIQHFGLRTMPPEGTTAIRLGQWEGAANGVIIAEDAKKYGPTDLSEGDACLYNNQTGVKVLLKASDGSVTIADKGGNTISLDGSSTIQINAGVVQINGSSYSLLKTDTFLSDLKAALDTISPANSGGSILSDGGVKVSTVSGAILAGSYLSSKAKNG